MPRSYLGHSVTMSIFREWRTHCRYGAPVTALDTKPHHWDCYIRALQSLVDVMWLQNKTLSWNQTSSRRCFVQITNARFSSYYSRSRHTSYARHLTRQAKLNFLDQRYNRWLSCRNKLHHQGCPGNYTRIYRGSSSRYILQSNSSIHWLAQYLLCIWKGYDAGTECCNWRSSSKICRCTVKQENTQPFALPRTCRPSRRAPAYDSLRQECYRPDIVRDVYIWVRNTTKCPWKVNKFNHRK